MKAIPGTLILTAPEDAELHLTSGEESILPERRSARGRAVFVFAGLPAGEYHVHLKSRTHYSSDQQFFWTEEDRAAGRVLEAATAPRGGRGWEPSDEVRYLAPAAEKILPSAPADFRKFAEYLQTPSFDPSLAAHETAHQGAVRAYLNRTIASCKNAWLFSMGKSGKYRYDLPLVIFTETDLSGASTPEEAAALLRGNGKVKVHYQAQIHGNEPASCEGALAQIGALCGKKGARLLERMDLLIFPRANPDGARAFTRNEVAQNANLNRDMFTARCPEVRALHRAVRAFRPEVVIDAHEYTFKTDLRVTHSNDILMSIGGGVNNGPALCRLSEEMMLRAIGSLRAEGLRGFAYNNVDTPKKGYTTNSINPTTGRLFRSLGGALSFLVESHGIRMGKNTFRRRTAAQFVAISDLLESVYDRAGEILEAVAAERRDLAARGENPDPARPFILRGETSQDPAGEVRLPQPRFDFATGECVEPDRTVPVYRIDTAVRSRPFPRAYLVPRGGAREKEILERLDLLGIEHAFLPAGAKVRAQGYRPSGEFFELTPEREVSFPEGAIRVPTAQSALLYAAYLFEPDIGDAREGATSFVQTGVLPPDSLFRQN